MVIVVELAGITSVAWALGLLISLLMVCGGLCFCGELDLIGSALLGLYSSVFVFLLLLALYFGSLFGQARPKPLVWGSGVIAFVAAASVLMGQGRSNAGVVWHDAYALSGDLGFQVVSVMHALCYRLFVVETFMLNFYLFLALVASMLFLGLAQTGGGPLGPNVGPTGVRNWRLRLIAKSRRQARRRNSGLIRWRQ